MLREDRMVVEGSTDFRTVFLSDLHLGWGTVPESYLLDFLKGLRTRSLYLVGDVLEWLYKPSGHVGPAFERFANVLGALQSIGTQITWISGNHDQRVYLGNQETIEIRRYLPSIHIRTHERYTAGNGKTYLVVHGDIYDYFAPRRISSKQLVAERLYPLYVRLLDRFPSSRLVRAMQARKSGDWLLAQHALRFKELMIELARTHDCQGVICGHIHVPECDLTNSFEYLNCGDWLEHRSYVAESTDGELTLAHSVKGIRR